jgi:hypothetical protein
VRQPWFQISLLQKEVSNEEVNQLTVFLWLAIQFYKVDLCEELFFMIMVTSTTLFAFFTIAIPLSGSVEATISIMSKRHLQCKSNSFCVFNPIKTISQKRCDLDQGIPFLVRKIIILVKHEIFL